MPENQTEIVAIQIGVKVDTNNLVKIPNFTTNCDYMGHTKSTHIPVYVNSKLEEKEIKQIMKSDFKKLPDGTYDCYVRQVMPKDGKMADKKTPDPSKKILVLELDVKGQKDYQYKTFYLQGYSEKQIEASKKQMNRIIDDFGIDVIEDLLNKECKLVVKTNDQGFSHQYINPKKEYFDWSKIMTFDGEGEFNCNIKQFKKAKDGKKYYFFTELNVNNNKIEETITIDMENQYGPKTLERIFNKLQLTDEDSMKEVNKPAKLKVVRKTKEGKTYFNKRIVFEKEEKEHHWKE